MRKLFIPVLLVLALAGGGFFALWITQSSKVEKRVADLVEQFNSGPMQLTYDTLEITGFPLQMNIDLINPKLSGRMDVLLDPHRQEDFPEWNETIALQGLARYGVDIFSSTMEIGIVGAWKNTSVIGDQTLEMTGGPNTEARCTLTLARNDDWLQSMWNFGTLATRGNAFISDFRLFDCFVNGLQVAEEKTSATLMQNGPQRVYISNEPQGDRHRIRAYIKGIDSVITPEGDRMIARYYRVLSPESIPPMSSGYGKQNVDVDFTYAGPSNWQAWPQIPSVEIHLGKFSLVNDAYNSNTTFDLTTQSDTQNQSSRVAFKSETVYNQIYNTLAQESVRGIIAQLIANPKVSSTLPPAGKDRHTVDSLYQVVAPAIPDFYSMGKSTAALDLSFQGASGFSSGNFTLSALELSTNTYGLTGTGTGARTTGGASPAVNVLLHCRNCLQMAEDLMLYSNRVRTIILNMQENTALPLFDTARIDGYKNFLRALAEDDGAGNFNFAVVSDGRSGVSINKKRMDEVLTLYHKLVPEPTRPRAVE